MGQPVLGRRETIKTFTRDELISHIRKYYGTRDLVISCAGHFEPENLINLLEETLGGLRRGSEPEKGDQPVFHRKIEIINKDLSEAHICLGVEGVPYSSKDRYCLFVLNTIFGAGVSSRLFQEIREKRGLAYSIYSFIGSYIDTGLWGVYAGVSRKKVKEVLEITIKEMEGLKDTISETELQIAKSQLKGNIILGLESSSSRMNNIARQEIYFGKYISPEEIMREIDSVNLKQVKELSEKLIKREAFSLTVYGPVQKDDLKGVL